MEGGGWPLIVFHVVMEHGYARMSLGRPCESPIEWEAITLANCIWDDG